MKTTLLIALIGSLAGAAGNAPAFAVETAPRLAQVEAVMLTVMAKDGVTIEQPSVGKIDVGTVDSFTSSKVEKDFVLRNDSKAPISIGRLQPTCGCTSVLLGEGNETTKTLAPGEEVKVRMSVDVSHFHGLIHKSVRAYSTDGDTLLATMNLDANIQDPVTLSTRTVDLGRLNFGGEKAFSLDVTLSPRLAAVAAPQLVSSTPDLVITPLKDAAPAPDAKSTAPTVQHYNIALSKLAPIGQINATLSLVAPKKMPAHKATPNDEETRIAESLQMATVAVTGEVVGKLSIMPRMVVFGAKQTTEYAEVNTGKSFDSKKFIVTSSTPWITTKWIARKTLEPNARTLELVLSPKAPAGALEAKITIASPDGERLELPVLADVAAKN